MLHFKKVMVKVQRDVMSAVTKAVFEHEAELLAEVHGESKVNFIEPSENDHLNHVLERPLYKAAAVSPGTPPVGYSKTWPLNLDDEYSRLSQVYGSMPESPESYVEHVFGPPRRSRIRDYAVREDPGYKVGAAPAEAPTLAAARAEVNLQNESKAPATIDEIPSEILDMSVNDLKAALDEREVAYKSKDRKGDLQKLLAIDMQSEESPEEIMDDVRDELERLGIEVDDDMTADEMRQLLADAQAEGDEDDEAA